ncbi:MAG: gamma-glutamylcyclotransferase [Zavarzinia sp.]|nr:gamma-glutamylcyclotransferase [Zavarzinia sp.]
MAAGDLFVFGYGSLIWRPGFPYLGVQPAILHGYHRAFCIYSEHYRGTPARRGLVLGLDRGGCCRGMVFRVAAEARDATLAYLRERELVTHVYKERVMPVRTAAGTVPALTYVADPAHGQYAGKLPFDDQVRIIAEAEGSAGRNRDYLAATVAELERLGLHDDRLHRLDKAVRARPEAPLGDHPVAHLQG